MKRVNKYILALLLILAVSPAAQLVAGKRQEIRMSILFGWDKSEHDAGYVLNARSLDSLSRAVKRIGPELIDHIDIKAYSSPEGSAAHNAKLGADRAEHLKNLIASNNPEIASKISCESGGEAWQALRESVIHDAGLTNWWKKRILYFLDDETVSVDTRKWRLEHKLGYEPTIGDMYKYLLKNHYPSLRSCTIVVAYDVLEEEKPVVEAAEVPEPVSLVVRVAEPEPVDTAAAFDSLREEARERILAIADGRTTPDSLRLREEARERILAIADSIGWLGADTLGAKRDSVFAAHEMQQSAGSTTEEHAVNLGEGVSAVHIREFVPMFGISTNIPYDITYVPGYGLTSIPSFSLEYYPAPIGRWTFGADVEWPMWQHWDTQRFMQINNITLWTRRYFRPSEGHRRGLYLLGNVNAARYGVGWDWKGWQGEGLGASAGIGHKWYLNRRLYIDIGAAVGVFYSGYDPYVYGNDAMGWYYYDYAGKPEDFQERNKRWIWFGPTRIYISIGLDFLNRNRK